MHLPHCLCRKHADGFHVIEAAAHPPGNIAVPIRVRRRSETDVNARGAGMLEFMRLDSMAGASRTVWRSHVI